MARAGGQSPHSYGLKVTVKVPTATSSAPVSAGDQLVLSTDGAYEAAPATSGDPIQLIAINGTDNALTPVGAFLFGFSRVHHLAYSGTAPAIGAGVVAAGDGTVRAADTGATPAEEGSGFVLFVDTARSYVEVAL